MRKPPVRIRWLLPTLLLGLLGGPRAEAGGLKGKVVGSAGEPKPYVNLQVSGPESRTLFSGRDGRFAVELPAGSYTLQITERNRTMHFDVRVPTEGEVDQTFTLKW